MRPRKMLKQEEDRVSSERIMAMESDGVKSLAASEPPAGSGAGPVELRHDPGTRLWHHHDYRAARTAGRPVGKHAAAAAARMVLLGCRQARRQKARGGRVYLFCSAAALGACLVEQRRTAPGLGPGCQHTFRSVHRTGDQRGVSRLCAPGGLEAGPDAHQRGVATALESAPGGLAREYPGR